MKAVITSYFINTIGVALALAAIFFASKAAYNKGGIFVSDNFRLIVFLLGAGCLLVAAIAKLGPEIQSWDASTPQENLNPLGFYSPQLAANIGE